MDFGPLLITVDVVSVEKHKVAGFHLSSLMAHDPFQVGLK